MSSKVKNFCKFSREQDELLLEMVSMHGALYDPSHEHYKDTISREKIWVKIGLALHRKGDVCKVRWRSIRDTYGKKKRDSKRGIECKNKYEYADQLAFLDDVSDDKIIATTPPAKIMKQENGLVIEETTLATGENVEYEPPQTAEREDGDEEDEKEEEETTKSVEHEQTQISMRRRHTLRGRKAATKRKKQANELLQKETKRGPEPKSSLLEAGEEHPVRTFFDSMAQTVIGFPPALQVEAKIKVCQLIGEMECRLAGAYSGS